MHLDVLFCCLLVFFLVGLGCGYADCLIVLLYGVALIVCFRGGFWLCCFACYYCWLLFCCFGVLVSVRFDCASRWVCLFGLGVVVICLIVGGFVVLC